MPTVEELLEPIPGENPCGENLYYAPVYDKIKEARRQDDEGPMGQWERDRKTADFTLVVKLAEESLLKKTKDIQIAVWLTEAWIYRDKIGGLAAGLRLLKGLVELYWDQVYPEIEDDDTEMRATPLEWLGSYFDPSKGSSPIFAVRATALTKSGLSWFAYKDSRAIGYESDVKGNEARTKARNAAIAEGKASPEEFDKEASATPKPFFRKLEKDCKDSLQILEELNELCREKFGQYAPSFSPLRAALEEFANTVNILLTKKLQEDPDPIEAVVEEQVEGSGEDAEGQPGAPASGGSAQPAFSLAELENFSGGQIHNGPEAVLHVLAAAQYLRRQTPASPVSYLILRGLRWGELRASGDQLDGLLDAPAPDIRRALRQYANQKDWKRLLETAESAMSSQCGRGWIDLQRYAIKACEELGHQAAAKAIRSELKTLLTDYPGLPTHTLNDDTGAANPETLAWLKEQGFIA